MVNSIGSNPGVYPIKQSSFHGKPAACLDIDCDKRDCDRDRDLKMDLDFKA